MNDDGRPYLTQPRLTAVVGLVHGFGSAGWPEADFLAFAVSRGLRPVIMRQVHSDTVHRLEEASAGKLEGDALMTDVRGLLLVVRTADCLPVFLVDMENRAVAVVHCGWRGTEKRILEKAVLAMGRAYGSEPTEILAALGPCIGSACYEVGSEVREGFLRAGFPTSVFTECQERGHVRRGANSEERPAESWLSTRSHDSDKYLGQALSPACTPGRPGKSLLDLRAANIWLLRGQGIKEENILDTGAVCTHCEPLLLSYRRDPADSRRMVNFIGLC